MALVLKPLSQRDPRWASLLLGNSSLTIGGYGCTLTALAMVAGLTPDEVNRRLLAVNGFKGALVIWTKIQEAIPWLKFTWRGTTYDNDAVKKAIDKNGFCLVEVDFDGRIISPNDHHWVVYKGEQRMIDPWTSTEKDTSYYSITTGYASIDLIGKPPGNIPSVIPEVPEPLQKYGKGSLTDLVSYIDEQNRFLTEARAEVSSLRQEIGTKNDVIENLGAQEKGFWDRISAQLPTEYTKDEKGLTERLSYASSLEDKYTSVQKAFDEAKNKYVGDLSNAQAQILSLKTAVERLEKQVADLQAQATIHKPDEVFSLVQKILKLLGKKK